MTITRTYTNNSTHELVGNPMARLGGPRIPLSAATYENVVDRVATGAIFGSYMPLDTEAHWDWRNPLNVIPALIVLLIAIALVAAIV
jgi:hypothetical protein